jgi:CubicO group peptidase (beta-lactamase class C family)
LSDENPKDLVELPPCQMACLRQNILGGQLSSAAEQRFCKPSVVGSIPTAGSISLMRIGDCEVRNDRPKKDSPGRVKTTHWSRFKKTKTTIVSVAVLALVVVAAGFPAAAETPSQTADALLNGLTKTNDPGLAVLVAQDGKILFEKCYGLADVEHHVPITPQTTFRIASITKQFTASAILKLQEGGKLSVNDKLSRYIPDFPRGNEVTLRQLLIHTSGIRRYTDKPGFFDRVTNATTTEAIIEAMKKDSYEFDPGTQWRYDNSGYMLLGYIVEKVSGQSYGDFLRENFFVPLGMTNTGVYRAHLDLPREALGYSLGKNGFKRALNWDMSWAGGAGALYSTVEDLYRWNEGIFNGRVLNAASLKAAFTPVRMNEDKTDDLWNDYGYGWMIGHDRALREIWHDGGIDGFGSCLLRAPDEQFTAVVLANAEPSRPKANTTLLAHRLAEIFLSDKLGPQLIANTNVPPESYDALTGRYDVAGAILTISRRGAHLFKQYIGRPKEEIFPKSDTEFFWNGGDAQITFVKDSSGKAVRLILHEFGIYIVSPRVKDIGGPRLDPAVYDSLAGKYDYGNGVVLTVTREGNHLFAQMTGKPRFEIFPKSEMTYFWRVMDAQVTFVQDAAGNVTEAVHHQGGRTIVAPKIQ